MPFPLSAGRIAECLKCPREHVSEYWPLILQCLEALSIGDEPVCVAALATIAVETAHTFRPLHEYGSDKLHEQEYGLAHPKKAKQLGNAEPGDGAKFAGRGFIQITGKINYEHYAKLLGTEMSSDPEKADAPYNAAVILAAFFMEQKIAEAARAGHWDSVRIRVNGGLNGWQDFIACVNSLMHAIVEMSAAPVDVDGEISV